MQPSNEAPELCLIDADSILYQICHKEPSPALRKKYLNRQIESITKETGASTAYTFIKGTGNFRNEWESYKAHRKDNTTPEVKQRILDLYEYAKEFALECDNAEADDYVTFTAKQCELEGETYVVAHIDKDLNCIPGWHYNFRTGLSYYVSHEEGYRFMMKQMLVGDSTDNITGIPKLGPKTADKLLEPIATEHLLGEVLRIWEDKIEKNWVKAFVECANLIYMRESINDIRALSFEELKERFTWKEPNGDKENDNTLDVSGETVPESGE